jgi:hypothetical protein
MNDVTKWKAHGAVETLRTEFATWDLDQQDWQPPRGFTLTSFRPDGKVSTSETHNPDGSVVHSQWLYDDARLSESISGFHDGPVNRVAYFYDEAGRHVRTVQRSLDGTQTDSEISTYDAGGKRTKIHFLSHRGGNVVYGVDGTEQAYGVPGATTMTITYDERDLPAKVLFQDANHTPLTYVVFMRDSTGRLLNEETQIGKESLFRDLLDKIPPEGREGMAALLQKTCGETLSTTTYVYDTRGRLVERMNKTGSLGGHCSAFHYDEGHDDPIEETTEHRSREASIDEDGSVRYTSAQVSVQHNRFEYRYDDRGNWTERIVSIRLEPNPGFQRSNIERRAITYHAP